MIENGDFLPKKDNWWKEIIGKRPIWEHEYGDWLHFYNLSGAKTAVNTT